MNMNKAAIAKRLRRLDACAVSDALDKLELPGSTTGLSQLATTGRIVGAVVTFSLARADAGHPPPAVPRHLGTTAIESSEPGDVIVVSAPADTVAGSWGGILSLGAKVKGVAGVVSDGFIRDVDEARQLDFPVWGRAATTRTARGRVMEIGTNVPVTVAGVKVEPGDWVIADGSGAVFIAGAHIERVLDAAETIVAREAAMAKDLLAGQRITEVMGANYEHMLKKEDQ